MRILHTADLHFSNNQEKLQEVVRTTDFLLQQASVDPPDVIVVGGDTVDEYDGRIRLDSDCARAAISFVRRAADIAPVVIVRGTKSHDRESPYLFQHLRGKHDIVVASEVQMVLLTPDRRLVPMIDAQSEAVAVFGLVPSLDKSHLMASVDAGSVRDGNNLFRNAVHDLFAGFGLVHDQFTSAGIPSILVTHGMLTGSSFSSGQTAIGEDLEFGLNDLHAAKASYVALGHVHKHQMFPGNVVYSGSPGRLNFGEKEEKGFAVAEFDGAACVDVRFVKTPARRFRFGDISEWSGADSIMSAVGDIAADCSGADVRFRFTIPDEERNTVDRAAIERTLLDAGAARVKLEVQIIPRQRQRAAGISRADLLTEKVSRWGDTVGEVVPDEVLALAGVIEGLSADELLSMATLDAMGENLDAIKEAA